MIWIPESVRKSESPGILIRVGFGLLQAVRGLWRVSDYRWSSSLGNLADLEVDFKWEMMAVVAREKEVGVDRGSRKPWSPSRTRTQAAVADPRAFGLHGLLGCDLDDEDDGGGG